MIMKVAVIVGARPQFIKAAPLIRELQATPDCEVVFIHSGQHFDENMSAVFFRELELPEPKHHLGIHSGGHGQMTGRMLAAIEVCLLAEKPDRVVVFGDTNTTLAGALAAAKLGIPRAHVEAGLRSWDRSLPEELNRVLVDHCSTWLFCPTDQAVQNLSAEGIRQGVHLVGDIMFDAVRLFSSKARARTQLLDGLGLKPRDYFVLTIHRTYNTEDASVLTSILRACAALPGRVLFPVHPRTRPLLAQAGTIPDNVIISEPLGYLDMLCVASNCRCMLTDSGGLQREAYFLGVPCVTLRPETEWVETVSAGWNVLAGTDTNRIVRSVGQIERASRRHIACFGDGRSAEIVCKHLQALPASDYSASSLANTAS